MLPPTVLSLLSFTTDGVVSQELRCCPGEAQPQAESTSCQRQEERYGSPQLSPHADTNGQVYLFLATDFWKLELGGYGSPICLW